MLSRVSYIRQTLLLILALFAAVSDIGGVLRVEEGVSALSGQAGYNLIIPQIRSRSPKSRWRAPQTPSWVTIIPLTDFCCNRPSHCE
jgi:hypothetical protein